jgi:2-keto-4-pentenoate hydratase/2-oxohepta-3-ene-1,7-dioic acid hydratase in catechol pathway
MKLLTYKYHDNTQVGIIGTDEAKVVPVSALGYQAADMTGFIRELGGEVPAGLLAKVDAASGVPFAECKLLAPIKYPEQDVLCLGVNYLEHRDETVKSDVVYDASGTNTIYFGKRVTEAVDPYGEIDGHFDIVDSLDYEVELAVIIGKDAKNVALADAKEYVLGYTILNDVSARNLQSRHQQWYFGKSLDGFTPIGPWIVTRDELPWLPKVGIRAYLNGELRQNSNTELMITNIDVVIHELSRGMTLKAGTIIAMGTPSGVGMGFNPGKYMHSGDVIRCEIDGIGVLENTVK